MSNCGPIIGLVLDSTSRQALEKISQKHKYGNALAAALSTGVLANIFVKNSAPQAAFNITQTDWDLYARSMSAVPQITKRAVEREVENMIIHYELNYDRQHLLFWKGIHNGCR